MRGASDPSVGRDAVSIRTALISAGVQSGCFCLTRAALPAARGAENDVPWPKANPDGSKNGVSISSSWKRPSPSALSSWTAA
jgi:hypothetical protein